MLSLKEKIRNLEARRGTFISLLCQDFPSLSKNEAESVWIRFISRLDDIGEDPEYVLAVIREIARTVVRDKTIEVDPHDGENYWV